MIPPYIVDYLKGTLIYWWKSGNWIFSLLACIPFLLIAAISITFAVFHS